MEIFETLVGPPVFTGSTNSEIIQTSLRLTLNTIGNLDSLHILSDLTVFREEVKVVKVKKGQIPEIIPENEIAIYLRNSSLKALCSIALSLSVPNEVDHALAVSFSNVATLVDSICFTLSSLRARFDNTVTRDGMIQEGIWGLILLIFILRNNVESMTVLLSSTETMAALLLFSTEESLSLYCLQIFEIISLSTNPLALTFLDENLVLKISDIVLRASNDTENNSAVTFGSANTPGKGGKEKEKPAKKDKNIVVEKSEKMGAVKQTSRQNLARIKIAASTLSSICERNGSAIDPDTISRVVQYFSKILMEKSLWDLAQTQTAEPYDINLCDVFDKCCIFIGAVGLIDVALL